MKLEDINFNIPFNKSDGCILINAKDWQDNTTQLLQHYNMKGEKCISNITKVLKVNSNKDIYKDYVKEGDLVMISRQASRVSYLSPYKIKGIEGDFANVHLLQVIGVFEGGKVSFDTLTPVYNKVIMKKIKVNNPSSLYFFEGDETIIGEVVKVGTNGFDDKWNPISLNIKVGQKILFRNNVTTDITLDGVDYMATEDCMCVGYFEGEDISIDNLKLFDKNVLLIKYESDKIEGSSMFIKPDTANDEVSDVSEFYQDDRYTIVKLGNKITNLHEGDNVIVSPDFLNYVNFHGTEYRMLSGTKDINAVFK